MRDYQRQKVYDSETLAMERFKERGIDNPRLETVQEMQGFVDVVVGSRWFIKHWGTHRIRVKDGRGRRRASGGFGYIKMPKWSRCMLYVLHELSHSIKPRQWSGVREASHGREFCKRLLKLVRHHMGKAAHDTLKEAMREKKVKLRGTDAEWDRRRIERNNRRILGVQCSPEVAERMRKARAARKKKEASCL
jgi:putative metallohydrolase (TIGR04338 family)